MTSSDGDMSRAVPVDADVPFLLGELGVDPLAGEARTEAVVVTDISPREAAAGSDGERTARLRELTARICRGLTALGPEGWTRMEAVFALTVAAEAGYVGFVDDQERVARVEPPGDVLAALREHRALSAADGDGPWWRLLIGADAQGAVELLPDAGEDPFPDDQLFEPEVYREDLRVFPRRRLPVWLAAYVWHDGRQVRTPRQAAAAARSASAPPTPMSGLPDLPALWGRWAVIAAAFLAIGSPRGPGVAPALAWYEDEWRSGSSLFVLPDGRAVLSGGVSEAPELDAAYNIGGALPDLYAGAPVWVADPVLDPRSRAGLLSFCYWWTGDRWYRGGAESDPGPALPAVHGAAAAAAALADLLETKVPPVEAISNLIGAAEARRVRRQDLAAVFADPDHDLDSAYYQLIIAGVTVD
ncbi:hypothetical protein [Nocardia aurantia]|uniref:Uncharacterized protein n=1 Tax=Nocardia aurantia TaxID=2585199 RepID=A0A7K0DGQ6_9NOCA|nr:hypothetical protein [Nocardia aurantia]MQY24985.1 hypothetical protein [Nocardia aurantia]